MQREEKESEEKISKEKKRKEKKEGGKENGVQGCPLCAADKKFPKERKNTLATKGKITRKKKQESRKCPLTILPIIIQQVSNSTSMPR